MTTAKTDETINRIIFKFMHPDGCWHEANPGQWPPECKHCHKKFHSMTNHRSDDYCSDLNLMAEVEKAVVEKFSIFQHRDALLAQFTLITVNTESVSPATQALTATARQRATACVAVIEENNGK